MVFSQIVHKWKIGNGKFLSFAWSVGAFQSKNSIVMGLHHFKSQMKHWLVYQGFIRKEWLLV